MACNFGWDWGPTLITAGIWKPIALEMWNTARIRSVRPLVTQANAQAATVEVLVQLEGGAGSEVEVRAEMTSPQGKTLELNTTVTGSQTECALRFEMENPSLWWPRGHGEQPLYELRVVAGAASTRLSQWNRESACAK
jgi:beta-mannosidase